MQETVRVGAAQIAPVLFDKDATLEKTVKTLEEAGRLGLDLIVFPESFFSVYPFWRGAVSVKQSTELVAKMQKSAIRLDGDEVKEIAAVARKANVNVVLGCNEMDDRVGSLTMYNSLFFISREGEVMGRHRKLVPTHSERVYWGAGDASDLRVFDMDIGMVGGLICYEHHVGLFRQSLAQLGEEIHCAVWPGWWSMERHLGDKRRDSGSRTCDVEPAIREHAIENQVFVVSANWHLPDEAIPEEFKPLMQYNLASGGSSIVNPSGIFLREPVFDKETIVWADIHAEDRRLAKAYLDPLGHYSRFDAVTLSIRNERWTPSGPMPVCRGQDRSRLDDDITQLAQRYDISDEELSSFRNEVRALVEGDA